MSINSRILDMADNRRYSLIKQKDEWRTIRAEKLRFDMIDLVKTNTRLEVLNQISEMIHVSLDTSEIYRKITEVVVHLLGYPAAFIVTGDGSETHARLKFFRLNKHILSLVNRITGYPFKELATLDTPRYYSSLNTILKGEIVIADKLSTIAYPLIGKTTCGAIQKLAGIRSNIALPITIDDAAVGVLFISSKNSEVTTEELKTIKYMSRSASVALKNARYCAGTGQTRRTVPERRELDNQTGADYTVRTDEREKISTFVLN